MRRKRRPTRARRGRYNFKRPRLPVLTEQRQFELVGMAALAVGVFFAYILYLSWDGGKLGDASVTALKFLFGYVAYLVPLALVAVGLMLILRQSLPDLAPYRSGMICLFASLTLALSAQAFGIGPDHPARQSVVYQPYLESHGGFIGEVIYWATSTLFQRIGAILVSVFLFLAALTLLTGVTISRLIELARSAVSKAAQGARASRQGISTFIAQERGKTEPYIEGQNGDGPAAGHGAVTFDDELYTVRQKEPPSQAEATAQSEGTLYKTETQPAGADDARPGQGTADTAGLTPMGARRSDVTESEGREYKLPSTDLLRSSTSLAPDTSNRNEMARKLIDVLGSFNVEAEVVGMMSGPHVTRYELRLAPGTKVAKVSQLRDDIAYALASTEIRILAPIPGKQAVGVEVPNSSRRIVHLGDIMKSTKRGSKVKGLPADASPLAVWLGKDVAGRAVWTDIAKMPHILVAGTTGSGKSGCVNAMLTSVLLRSTPDQVRMVLVDPKQVELNYYESIPHLIAPLVTVPRLAANVLGNLVKEMESRYTVMSEVRARHITEFNKVRARRGEPTLPHILCVVDELADMMMIAPADVEDAIIRLAQKSRAVGIHLVLATQRPSTDIITGTIKVNVPARIAFAVSSQVDSRVILDQGGAESLLGQGDMLFRPAGTSKLQRIQGAYVTEEEIDELTSYWAAQGEPDISEELLHTVPERERDDGDLSPDEDELLEQAITMVVQTQTASVSMLQRRLRVGYTRAGRLIDMLERRGIISGYEGSKPRQVLIQESDLPRVLQDQGLGVESVSIETVAAKARVD